MKYRVFIFLILFIPMLVFSSDSATIGTGFSSVSHSFDSYHSAYVCSLSGMRYIYADNCYLTAAYYGAYGEYYNDRNFGFWYNLTEQNPPDHYDGFYAYTDSPGGTYGNNLDISCGLVSPVSISSGNNTCTLEFMAHWYIEEDNDGVLLEVSIDGGDWISISDAGGETEFMVEGSGMGVQDPDKYYFEGKVGGPGNYKYIDVNFDSYIGHDVRFRFRLVTDLSNFIPYDGIYVDAIKLVGDVTGTIYEISFDGAFYNWQGDSPWGKTVATSGKSLLSHYGQFVAGNSSDYVAIAGYGEDRMGADWEALSSWHDGPPANNCWFYNNLAPDEGPHFKVWEICYGQGADDFIVIDTYLINDSDDETINNLHIGFQISPDVVHNEMYDPFFNDRARYDPSYHMGYVYNDDEQNEECVGIVFLSDEPTTVNIFEFKPAYVVFVNYVWDLISNGEIDTYPSPDEPRDWAFAMSVGPINDFGPGDVKRVCFAFVGGDDLTDLQYNAERAFSYYYGLHDFSSNIGIESTSLGLIKAQFK